MIKVSLSACVLAILFMPIAAFAEQCPAINCDCTSLSNASWANACTEHEKRIKKACVANANVPKDYCALHGPSAKPLALALSLAPLAKNAGVAKDGVTDVAKVDEKIAAVYWAIYADTDEAKEAFDEGRFARTMQIFKLVDTNIAQLFNLQRQAAVLLQNDGNAEALPKAWRKYGEDSNDYAKKIRKFGVEIADKIDDATSAKEKKIYSVLSQMALRMAGEGYEHAAYALGMAGAHKASAKSWQAAAGISERLIAINQAAGVKESGVKFTKLQVAARLHRASYHWLLDEDRGDAIKQLEKAQAFVDQATVENIAAVIAAEKVIEKEESFLSRFSGR